MRECTRPDMNEGKVRLSIILEIQWFSSNDKHNAVFWKSYLVWFLSQVEQYGMWSLTLSLKMLCDLLNSFILCRSNKSKISYSFWFISNYDPLNSCLFFLCMQVNALAFNHMTSIYVQVRRGLRRFSVDIFFLLELNQTV